jgi:hypothetical protein
VEAQQVTKEEISDLKSLIVRSNQCATQLLLAEQAKKEADRQMEVFLQKVAGKE